MMNPLRQVYERMRAYCLRHGAGCRDGLWSGLVLILGVALFVMAWPGVDRWLAMVLVAALVVYAWVGRDWPAMQMATLALLLGILIGRAWGQDMALQQGPLVLATGLLWFYILNAIAGDLLKRGLPARYSISLVWLALVLLAWLAVWRWLARQADGLVYTALPLTTLSDVLHLAALAMVFIFLWFLRRGARFQMVYIGLLPATLTLMVLLGSGLVRPVSDQPQTQGLLEHALLLWHVPAMILGLALMASVAGLAVLRLVTDGIGPQGGQNRDVLETVQHGLEDHLYRLLAMAVISMGLGLLAGWLWSSLAWGHYWFAEGKQLMSLALWLYCLAGLHLRLQKGMPGRAFAWWCLAGLPLVFVTVIGTNLWSQGLHSF